MVEYNRSQRAAITDALRQRVSLIQGPPGTGKTKVLAAIVANMHLRKPHEKILVLATRNETADLVAGALYSIEALKDKVCRLNSKSS